MQILQGFEELVHNILLVNFLKNVGPNDSMQICLCVNKDMISETLILNRVSILKVALLNKVR